MSKSNRSRAGSSALAAFRERNFRLQWPADLMTSWGFEMETLILGWYILTKTESVLLLTLFGALQFVGTLFAPLLGVAADRRGHRNVLFAMRLTYAVLAGTLLALAATDQLGPTSALVIAGLSGLVRPTDQGMRVATTASYMPARHLLTSMGISRTTSDSARVAGALSGAGIFAVFGITYAYVAVTILYFLGAMLTLAIRTRPRAGTVAASMPRPSIPSPWRDLTEGLGYIWRTPALRSGMWLAFLVNATAFPITMGLMPYVAKNIYGVDQTGLGLLLASFSLGALLGSLFVSVAGSHYHAGRLMMISTTLWYVMLLAFTFAPNEDYAMACLSGAGFAQSLNMVTLSAWLLKNARDELRGRVMGVRMLAIYSLPVGILVAGPLIQWAGFRATSTGYALIGLAFTAVIIMRWRDILWASPRPTRSYQT